MAMTLAEAVISPLKSMMVLVGALSLNIATRMLPENADPTGTSDKVAKLFGESFPDASLSDLTATAPTLLAKLQDNISSIIARSTAPALTFTPFVSNVDRLCTAILSISEEGDSLQAQPEFKPKLAEFYRALASYAIDFERTQDSEDIYHQILLAFESAGPMREALMSGSQPDAIMPTETEVQQLYGQLKETTKSAISLLTSLAAVHYYLFQMETSLTSRAS